MRRRLLEAVLALCIFAVIPLTQNGDIHDAARAGNLAEIRAMLEWSPELVGARDSFGRTPLAIVAALGRADVARLLLDRGADVNATDRFGDTPLTLAVWRGSRPVVRLLLQRGAIPPRGSFGNPPYSQRASSSTTGSGSASRHRSRKSS